MLCGCRFWLAEHLHLLRDGLLAADHADGHVKSSGRWLPSFFSFDTIYLSTTEREGTDMKINLFYIIGVVIIILSFYGFMQYADARELASKSNVPLEHAALIAKANMHMMIALIEIACGGLICAFGAMLESILKIENYLYSYASAANELNNSTLFALKQQNKLAAETLDVLKSLDRNQSVVGNYANEQLYAINSKLRAA